MPKSFLKKEYMAIKTNTIKIKGLINDSSTMVIHQAPKPAPINAAGNKNKNSRKLIGIFLEYLYAANAVPEKDGILVVPSKVAIGYCGNKNIIAGVCIRPPPPAIESTSPAKNENKQIKIICMSKINLKSNLFYQ